MKEMASISSSELNPSSSPPAEPSNCFGHCRGRVLYPVLAIFNILVFLLLVYYIWKTSFCRRSRRMDDAGSIATVSSAGSSRSASMRREARVSPDVLSSMPVFVHSMADGEKLECSVCLTEFREGDKGRRLPRCGHRFHADCVDVWFQSQSTCPICRSAIDMEGKAPQADGVV